MNQTQFAVIGGVKKLSQIGYENGDRLPSGPYLSSIAHAGVDIAYILIGKRIQPIDEITQLLPAEQEWLMIYRDSSAEVRNAFKCAGRLLSEATGRE